MWQIVIACLIGLALAVLLYRGVRRAAAARAAMPEQLFGPLRSILDDVSIHAGETAGVYRLSGTYRGEAVAIQAVTDLLMLRKLPSLWLMVTLPGELAVPATLDMVLRPAGQTSFSNFDFLPVTLEPQSDFPETAVVRTDSSDAQALIPVVARHQRLLVLPRLKEVLISPKGVRLVTLLAEADRARYGVFRQAEFGDVAANPDDVRLQLDLLLELKASLTP